LVYHQAVYAHGKMGIEVKPSWKEGNKKVCDALVRLWKKNHQLGQFVDSRTGEIIVGGSSSGAIVPAALGIASTYYGDQEYLKVAEEIADYYNLNFTKKESLAEVPVMHCRIRIRNLRRHW